MTPDVHFLAAVLYVIPERRLVTFPCVHRGRLVRRSISGAALSVLWGRAVQGEADMGEAFAACRGRVEALVRAAGARPDVACARLAHGRG
jgi:hypothetical protein